MIKEFRLNSNELDVADVIMYALDNGKHSVDIRYYENSTVVTIFPIKVEEKVDHEEEEPEDVKNCNNCKHRGSVHAWKPIDSTSIPSPCYTCVIPYGGRNVPSHWEPKEKENVTESST